MDHSFQKCSNIEILKIKQRSCLNKILYFISRCQPRPWFISSSVIILSLGHLHIIVEADDLPFFQLFNCRSKTQLKYHTQLLQILVFLNRYLQRENFFVDSNECYKTYINCYRNFEQVI